MMVTNLLVDSVLLLLRLKRTGKHEHLLQSGLRQGSSSLRKVQWAVQQSSQ